VDVVAYVHDLQYALEEEFEVSEYWVAVVSKSIYVFA
jgi:hypothetical protein